MTLQTLFVVFAVLLISCGTRVLPAAKPRQLILLAGSYVLYASLAGPAFLALLIASSLMNYGWGGVLRRRPSGSLLWAAIASNVLLLSFFKYLPPLAAVWPGPFSELDFVQRIVLPLGVSFWTFQALSYLIGTYLEEEDLDPTLPEFCLYMAFWPTVAAGPVCRLPKMLPQFRKKPGPAGPDFAIGSVRLIQGLFMKLVLAQLLTTGVSSGGGVNAGWDAAGVIRSGPDVWALAIGFGFQLFFDFAGYSHIVIGAARLVGIQLEENFNRPYLSTSPAMFWTRWHMSLSFWIRDYVYTPMATIRRSQWWRYAALAISMIIFGFWHDAKMTLILWGLYHGLVLVGHRVGQQIARRVPFTLPSPVSTSLSWAATFLLMCLGYVFFRGNGVEQVAQMLSAVLRPGTYAPGNSTLPHDFYLLVATLALSYFAFAGMARLSILWSDYCQRRTRTRTLSVSAKPVAATDSSAFYGALEWMAAFIAVKKWWLVTPVLALMLVITGVSYLGQGADIAPFIYTLF